MITHTFTARIYEKHGYTPIFGEITCAKNVQEALLHAAELLQSTHDIPGHRIQITVTLKSKPKAKLRAKRNAPLQPSPQPQS